MSTLSIDFETRSTVDLRRAGVYPYAASPDTDVLCMGWAFDDEEPAIWIPPKFRYDVPLCRGRCGMRTPGVFCERCGWEQLAGLPDRVLDHIANGGELRAWNAQFERVIWNYIMRARYGAPIVKLDQWVDTAAEAAAMALPRSLDSCGAALGVSQQKDKEGHALMMKMSRPRLVTENEEVVWWDDAKLRERLHEYCKQDVRTERAIARSLRRLSPHERDIYLLDQRINDRGVRVDTQLVLQTEALVARALVRANIRLRELTSGAVETVTKTAQLRAWLSGVLDVEVESVNKLSVAEMLANPAITEQVREALQLRADAGRSSVAKMDAMLTVVEGFEDARMRGLFLYHAATTGRWGGKLVQPHNFPRGEVKDVESFIPDILAGNDAAIAARAHPVVVASSLLRGMIVPAPGFQFVAGDYSAIEARVLNWLAGQDDVTAQFAQHEDVYVRMASRLYGLPEAEITDKLRATGKFAELGCGFGMGAKKAVSSAVSYGLTLDENEARRVVMMYRETHPAVTFFWKEAEYACVRAVEHPGEVQHFGVNGNLRAVQAGAYLIVLLPSGRPLSYAAPRVIWDDGLYGARPTLTYVGEDSSRTWGRMKIWGGTIVENVVQATARDILADAMLALDNGGFRPVMHVHDEIVCEVECLHALDDIQFVELVADTKAIMERVPVWAQGCPIEAKVWVGSRYRKG